MSKKSESETPPPAERRPVARKRVLLGGVAVHQLKRDGVNVQIRDISPKGARVSLPPSAILPAQLYLIVVREQMAYEAEVIWRKGNDVGLSFGKAIDLHETDAMTAHLAKICARQRRDYVSWR